MLDRNWEARPAEILIWGSRSQMQQGQRSAKVGGQGVFKKVISGGHQEPGRGNQLGSKRDAFTYLPVTGLAEGLRRVVPVIGLQ